MKANEKTPLFKKPINLIVVLVPLFLFNSLVSKQCKCNKQGKIVITKPVKAPVAISFLDANRLLRTQIPNVKVTLIDDGGQVVTPNNLSFSSIEIKGGVMALALRDSARFNSDIPYRFAIKAEAPGYSTNFRTIIIREDKAQYIPLYMTKIDDPPAGAAGFAGNIPITNSTINAETTLIPKTTNNKKRKVSVKFPNRTVFLHNGKPLNEKVTSITCNFSYGSPTSLSALRAFPGGPLVTDAVDAASGEILATPRNPFQFTSAGWLTLEMKSNYGDVTEFSNAVELTMPISDSLLNPVSLKPYKAGDKIDIWSLNDRCVWKKENQTEVKTSDDGLIAIISIKHLSPWNLDFKTNICTATDVHYNNTAASITAPCEIVTTLNGSPLGMFPNNVLSFNTGSGVHTILNGPNGVNATILVYDNSITPNILATSTFTFCNGIPPPDININSLTVHSVVVDFTARDPSNNDYPLCNNAVFFLDDALFQAGNSVRYGDNLNIDASGKVGTGTLYQDIPYGLTHIRLFYGGLMGGMTISQTVDCVVDLSTTDIDEQSAIGTTITGVAMPRDVKYRFVPGGHIRIIVPAGTNGVTILSSCL